MSTTDITKDAMITIEASIDATIRVKNHLQVKRTEELAALINNVIDDSPEHILENFGPVNERISSELIDNLSNALLRTMGQSFGETLIICEIDALSEKEQAEQRARDEPHYRADLAAFRMNQLREAPAATE